MFRAIQFVLVAVVLFGMSAVAQAGHIPLLQNNTTGGVVFDTGFELPNNVVGSAPGTPDVGTGWTPSLLSGDTVDVADSTVTGVAAYEGNQYLRFSIGSGSGGATIMGNGVAANSGAGEEIMMTMGFRTHAPENGNHMIFMFKEGATDLGRIYFAHDTAGGGATMTFYGGPGGNWQSLTQTFTPYEWNTLVVKHQNGTQNFSISTNGSAFETVTWTPDISARKWCDIGIATNGRTGQVTFYDAVVPEPSTLALLASGLLGLLCYAWRKRK